MSENNKDELREQIAATLWQQRNAGEHPMPWEQVKYFHRDRMLALADAIIQGPLSSLVQENTELRAELKVARSETFKGWRDNVALKLMADRDAAIERYIREHKRAIVMCDAIHNAYDAIPDIDGRSISAERMDTALHGVLKALARCINAFGGDDAWYEQNFDFDEWERDYFGPRPLGVTE